MTPSIRAFGHFLQLALVTVVVGCARHVRPDTMIDLESLADLEPLWATWVDCGVVAEYAGGGLVAPTNVEAGSDDARWHRIRGKYHDIWRAVVVHDVLAGVPATVLGVRLLPGRVLMSPLACGKGGNVKLPLRATALTPALGQFFGGSAPSVAQSGGTFVAIQPCRRPQVSRNCIISSDGATFDSRELSDTYEWPRLLAASGHLFLVYTDMSKLAIVGITATEGRRGIELGAVRSLLPECLGTLVAGVDLTRAGFVGVCNRSPHAGWIGVTPDGEPTVLVNAPASYRLPNGTWLDASNYGDRVRGPGDLDHLWILSLPGDSWEPAHSVEGVCIALREPSTSSGFELAIPPGPLAFHAVGNRLDLVTADGRQRQLTCGTASP